MNLFTPGKKIFPTFTTLEHYQLSGRDDCSGHDSQKVESTIRSNANSTNLSLHTQQSSLTKLKYAEPKKGFLHSIEELTSMESMRFQAMESVRFQFVDEKQYKPNSFDVWAMGMTTVLGGVYYGWNVGLESGFGAYFVAQTLMGLSYIVLIFALAEIVSITSFSGGAYGMTRVVLGFYPGFIIASFELMEYLFYTAAAVQFIVEFVCMQTNVSMDYYPLLALVFYLIAGVFLFEGNHWYWRFNMLLGIVSVLVLVIYCVVSLPFTDFSRNASLQTDSGNASATDNWFNGGAAYFFQVLPYTTWGFGGIESAALCTDMIENPRENLPRGIAAGVVTLFIIMTVMIFVAASLPSGGLIEFANMTYYMETGWGQVGVSSGIADWLIIPAQFAMAFGFMLPSARLIYNMAQSKLIPSGFLVTATEEIPEGLPSASPPSSKGSAEITKTNYNRAILVSMIISYIISLVANYVSAFDITNIPILCAFITYLSDLYAYYRLQTDFASSERRFKSPFGRIGAICAGSYFVLGIVSIVGFLPNPANIDVFVAVLVALLSIYYFLYAKHTQIFSDQEQRTLLTLHVTSHNRRKREKKARQQWQRRFTKFIPFGSVRRSIVSVSVTVTSAHSNDERSLRQKQTGQISPCPSEVGSNSGSIHDPPSNL